MSSNFVAEIPKAPDPAPSCHVCGCAMTLCAHKEDWPEVRKFWKCLACGTTTECS